MKLLSGSLFLACLLACGAAQAHAHLLTSTPAEGSTLASPPAALVLTFSEFARVTVAAVQKGKEAKQVLHGLPTNAAATVVIPLPVLSAGAYTATWRLVGADGHVMSGQLHFSIASPATVLAAPSH